MKSNIETYKIKRFNIEKFTIKPTSYRKWPWFIAPPVIIGSVYGWYLTVYDKKTKKDYSVRKEITQKLFRTHPEKYTNEIVFDQLYEEIIELISDNH